MKKRENGLDLLRIISAFFVVALHVCTNELKMVKAANVLNAEFFFFTIIRHFTSIAVVCFFCLSGAFILKAGSTADYMSFYKKTWKKIVIPTIVFSIFFFFFESFIYYRVGVYSHLGDISYGTALMVQLTMLLTGIPAEHMWYMFTLIGLYLLAPFVVIVKERIGERAFGKAAVALCVWGTIDALIQAPKVYWSLGFCADLLGMFMLGYVVHEWALKRKDNRKLGLRMLGAGFFVYITEYCIYLLIRGNESLTRYITPETVCNVFAIAAALCFVAALTILNVKRNFGYPSLLTFWVYLVHPIVMSLLFVIETVIFHVSYMEIGQKEPILVGTANTLIVFVLSFTAVHIVQKCLSYKKKSLKGNA